MNKAPYRKKIKNLEKRSDIRLLNDMTNARQRAKKPHFIE